MAKKGRRGASPIASRFSKSETAATAPSMFTDGSLADLLFRAVDTMLVGALEKRGAPPELARIMAMTDDERAEIGPEVSARLDYWFGHYKVNADLLVAFKVGGLYWRKWNALTRAIQQWQASQGNAAAAPGAPTQ